MNKSLFIQRVFVLMAIAFILFQSFIIPLSSAAWSGTPWRGEPWEGDSWENESWNGDSWQGDAGTGGGPQSGSPDGQSGNIPDIENGVPGIGPVQPPYKLPDYLPGDNYNRTDGNGNPAYPGLISPGNKIGGGSNSTNPGGLLPGSSLSPGPITSNPAGGGSSNEPSVLETVDFVGNTIINGQVSFTVDVLQQGDQFKPGSVFGRPNFLTNILVNGIKLGVGDGTWFDYVEDMNTAIDMGFGIYDTAEAYTLATRATSAADAATDIVPTVLNAGSTSASTLGILSKFNIATAGISTAFSAVNAVNSLIGTVEIYNSDAKTSEKVSAGADTFSKFGETVFNAGLLASAIPGGQTAGLILAGVGAGMWVVGKGVKYVADNWENIKSSKIGKAVADGWDNLKSRLPFGWGS